MRRKKKEEDVMGHTGKGKCKCAQVNGERCSTEESRQSWTIAGRHTHTDIDTHRQTDIDTDTHTDTDTDTHRHTHTHSSNAHGGGSSTSDN